MRLWEYIEQGGSIMYILLVLNIVGFAVILSKIFVYKRERQVTDDTAGSLASKVGSKEGKDPSAIIELARQEIALYISEIEKGLASIKIIATVAPLLGLLGTVIGIFMSFKVMSETGGLGNPGQLVEGISLALITTIGGLIVAIPHFVAHSYLIGMLDSLEAILEKKVLAKLLA